MGEKTIYVIMQIAQLLANLVVIVGAVPVFFWLKNRAFEKKKKEIADNLSIRDEIKEKLREHADGYDRREAQNIGIRLVHWKNYPWKLDDDGYKQTLYYDTNLDKRVGHGTEFLGNTGIFVEDHIWYFSKSLYLGKYGIYIIDDSGKKIEGFEEVEQKIKIVDTLKYKYIVNWDFEEKIEYEPVFYMKYKYTNKKLLENQIFAQNFDDDGISKGLYFYETLDKRMRVESNKSIKYYYLYFIGKRRKRIEIRKITQPHRKAERLKKKLSKHK